METKFTKGSWGVTKTPEYHEPKCSRIEIHSDKQDGWICKVQTDGVIGQDEGFANAKLIAAAPEMFEALELSLKQMESDWLDADDERGPFMQEFGDLEGAISSLDDSTIAIRAARAALKKATE